MNECQVGNSFLSSIFSGTSTPTFCEFTRKISKFHENEHTPGMCHQPGADPGFPIGASIYDFAKISPKKNCMKLRNLWSKGGCAGDAPSLRSANANSRVPGAPLDPPMKFAHLQVEFFTTVTSESCIIYSVR